MDELTLLDIIQRQPVPDPWIGGGKIPWDEENFSRRMLAEHLSQEHDAASRRLDKINQHVHWIHRSLLGSQPTRILDLGCGPGLYANRLAELGHSLVGIDFSPASIEYASQTAKEKDLDCTFVQQDLRQADFGETFGLVMFIFGEFNTFTRSDARKILSKSWSALDDNGWLLLEVSTFEGVCRLGKQAPSWYTSQAGLFSDRPHLTLQENFWDVDQAIATERYYIIDADSGSVSSCSSTNQAYTQNQYDHLLKSIGFSNVNFWAELGESKTAVDYDWFGDFISVTARKQFT